jgi:hypothetical protein
MPEHLLEKVVLFRILFTLSQISLGGKKMTFSRAENRFRMDGVAIVKYSLILFIF